MRKSGIYTAVFAAFLMTTTAFAADVTPSVNTQTADSAIQAPVQKKDGHKAEVPRESVWLPPACAPGRV